MEFLFELILEFFGEVLLGVAFEALAEAGLHMFRRPAADAPPTSFWKAALGYALLGLIFGGMSLWAMPSSFIHHPAARWVSLLLTPVLCGLSMVALGRWRRRRGQHTVGLDRFLYGWLFAMALALVRFFFAH